MTDPISSDSIKGEILIVDDQPNNLRVLSSMLTNQGYDVRPVTSGQMALNSVQMRLPDIILLDINMPEMNGYEVCQRIKANERTCDIPIIFISVLDEVMDKVKAFSIGGVDYVTKPFQVEEVLARVETHLTIQRTKNELERVNAAYERFVPHDILNLLKKGHITETGLSNNVEQEMTIMFVYVRAFHQLSQQMTPYQTFAFVNSYLSRACPVIRHHSGFIASYIGEAVMALFPHSPDDAVHAALAMFEEVVQYNILRNAEGNSPISIGIGLHTDVLRLGIIGEPQRLQTTIISEAVNVAASMERLTKHYGVSIVMSSPMYERLSDSAHYDTRMLDLVQVKGKPKTITALELLISEYDDTVPIKRETREMFEMGVKRYYQKDFTKAIEHFERVIQKNPQDMAARRYLEQSKLGIPYARQVWNIMETITDREWE